MARRPGDWVRGAVLIAGFAILGSLVVTRYTGPGRFEAHRRLVRDFFHAARLRDTTRLRALVSTEQPIEWALAPRNHTS